MTYTVKTYDNPGLNPAKLSTSKAIIIRSTNDQLYLISKEKEPFIDRQSSSKYVFPVLSTISFPDLSTLYPTARLTYTFSPFRYEYFLSTRCHHTLHPFSVPNTPISNLCLQANFHVTYSRTSAPKRIIKGRVQTYLPPTAPAQTTCHHCATSTWPGSHEPR